jgi:type II secretory pathway component PulJ
MKNVIGYESCRFIAGPFRAGRENARCKGVTLVELLVALAIGMVLSAVVMLIFLSGTQTNKTQKEIAEVQKRMMYVMDVISKDIRNAGLRTNGGTFHSFTFTNINTITTMQINMDLNDDGKVPTATGEQVIYTFSGSTLNRKYNTTDTAFAEVVLADNLNTAGINGFYLHAGPFTGLNIQDNIDSVRVRLSFKTKSSDPNKGSIARNIERTVGVRNYGIGGPH